MVIQKHISLVVLEVAAQVIRLFLVLEVDLVVVVVQQLEKVAVVAVFAIRVSLSTARKLAEPIRKLRVW